MDFFFGDWSAISTTSIERSRRDLPAENASDEDLLDRLNATRAAMIMKECCLMVI